jgi:Flp pilus assembly protein TadD
LLYVAAGILAQQGASPGTPESQQAMRSAKTAVSLRPQLGPARSVLAKLCLSAGQYSEAAEQCRWALSLNPKDQAAVYHLIQALRRIGDKAEIPDLVQRLAQLREEVTKD